MTKSRVRRKGSSVLAKTYSFMNLTKDLKPSLRLKIYKQLRGKNVFDILKSFKEFAVNYKAGNIPVAPALRPKLKKHESYLTKLRFCNIKRCCMKRASKLIQQGSGAILPIIIAALAPIISSLITSKIEKSNE